MRGFNLTAPKNVVLLLVVALALTVIPMSPANAGTGPSPFITLRNTTYSLPSDNPFYMTTIIDVFTVGQKDSPTSPNWIWHETFELVVGPQPDFFEFQPQLQHQIDPTLLFGFTLEGTMLNEVGIGVGPCNAQNEDEPIPEQPEPDFIPLHIEPLTVPPTQPDLVITSFKIVAYANPVYEVGEGLAWYGISVEVDVDPDTLNLASNGKHVTINLKWLVYGTIDESSLRCKSAGATSVPISIEPLPSPSEGLTLQAKFLRAEVIDHFRTSDVVEETGKFRQEKMFIYGLFLDGTRFAGVDTIKIVDPAY